MQFVNQYMPTRIRKFSKLVFFAVSVTLPKWGRPQPVPSMFYAEMTCFHPFWVSGRGGGGGAPKGLVHNLLMQFFNPDSSKIEVFETCFFDIVTTQNDHPK